VYISTASAHFGLAAFLDRITSAYPGIDATRQIVTALAKPCFFNSAQALFERMPEAQQTMIGMSLNFSSSPIRSANLAGREYSSLPANARQAYSSGIAHIDNMRVLTINQQ
jgi:hypothetical protein